MLLLIKHYYIVVILMQSKQILFHIFMRKITECHPTYYSDNQLLTHIMHRLKQIENLYKKGL